MADKQQDLIDKPLHPNAVELARESVDDYAASVIVLAKTLAYQRGDDEVLSTHIYEALEIIQSRRRRRRWKDFVLAIGGALFGAFVSGFITELSTGHSKLLLAVYVVLGVLGMVLMFAGLQD
jgi:peptidoglycan/LPS O-acetylase OafA/YrhL